MAARVLKVPGTLITGDIPGAPILLTDADLLHAGSLVLFEPGSPTAPFSSVPANAALVTNLAATPAAALLGAAANVAFVNTFANSGEGTMELTTKKGLHIKPSRSASVSGHNGGLLFGSALATYLAAHKTNDLFLSLWVRITGTVDTSLTSAFYYSRISYDSRATNEIGVGIFPPTSARTTTPNPGLGRRIGTTAPAGSLINGACDSVTGVTTLDTQFVHVGPTRSAEVNKVPAAIIYRLYLEDLTVSGRTYAAVDAIDYAMYQQEMVTPGGRYVGDTYTAPV